MLDINNVMPIKPLFTKEDSEVKKTPEVKKAPEVPEVPVDTKPKDADRIRRLTALGFR
jgi:hypothetical protein